MRTYRGKGTIPYWIRLAILLIVGLTPLALVMIAHSAPRDDLEGAAVRTASEYDRLLRLRAQQVFAISAFPSIRAFAASEGSARTPRASVALNELQAWVAADRNLREALIVDSSGLVIMTTSDGWARDLGTQKFVRDALAGGLAASAPVFERGEYSMYYAAPIFNNSREIVGALAARIAAQELWDAAGSGEGWYTILVDEDGTVLADAGSPARQLQPLEGALMTRYRDVIGGEESAQEFDLERPARSTDWDMTETFDVPAPFGSNGMKVAAARLTARPWVVLAVAPAMDLSAAAREYAIPAAIAVFLACAASAVFTRV